MVGLEIGGTGCKLMLYELVFILLFIFIVLLFIFIVFIFILAGGDTNGTGNEFWETAAAVWVCWLCLLWEILILIRPPRLRLWLRLRLWVSTLTPVPVPLFKRNGAVSKFKFILENQIQSAACNAMRCAWTCLLQLFINSSAIWSDLGDPVFVYISPGGVFTLWGLSTYCCWMISFDGWIDSDFATNGLVVVVPWSIQFQFLCEFLTRDFPVSTGGYVKVLDKTVKRARNTTEGLLYSSVTWRHVIDFICSTNNFKLASHFSNIFFNVSFFLQESNVRTLKLVLRVHVILY